MFSKPTWIQLLRLNLHSAASDSTSYRTPTTIFHIDLINLLYIHVRTSNEMTPPVDPKFDLGRAFTEDEMMAAHAEQLRAAGTITDDEAKKLSKPWHKTGILSLKYSKEYLQKHPDYTGDNAHKMPSHEHARQKQVRQDAEQRKMIEDFEAGRIDQDRKPFRGGEQDDEEVDSKDDDDEKEGDDDQPDSESSEEEDSSSHEHRDDDTDKGDDRMDYPGGNTGNSSSDYTGDEDVRSKPQHQNSSSDVNERTPNAADHRNRAMKNGLQPFHQKVPSINSVSTRPWAISVARHCVIQERKEMTAQQLYGGGQLKVGRPLQARKHERKEHVTSEPANNKRLETISNKGSMDATNQRNAMLKDRKRKHEDDTAIKAPVSKKPKTTIATSKDLTTGTSIAVPASTSLSSSSSSTRTISVPSPLAPFLVSKLTTMGTSSSFEAASKPRRQRMSGTIPALLTPLPGKPDYSQFSYHQIIALCRERELPRKGNTQVLRNLLVQDDIDAEQGNERNTMVSKPSRKNYKTAAPNIE